jgi:hypothetical protein
MLQVDQVSAQLKEAQQQLEDKQRLATSLSGAERGRLEAEEKLAAALRHNSDTQVGITGLLVYLSFAQAVRRCHQRYRLQSVLAVAIRPLKSISASLKALRLPLLLCCAHRLTW